MERVLIFLTALLAAIWYLKRFRAALIGAIVMLAALVGFLLWDRMFESPSQEATRKMKAIGKLTRERKLDEAFQHVSASFQYHDMDKKKLLEKGKWAESIPNWGGVDFGDFDRNDSKMLDDNRVQIGFDAWVAGYRLPDYQFYCKATFLKDPDGQFRLQTLEFHKNRDANSPIVFPEEGW